MKFKKMWLFHLIRFPNLLIVAVTQVLLYHLILLPAFQSVELIPILDYAHFVLFTFITMSIAASGYIINDIVDYDMDLLNKPEKVIIHRKISVNRAWQLYWAIVLGGGILSLYLAFFVQNVFLFFIYPLAVGLLYAYSTHFKKQVLIGNIIVSIFCAFVAGIVLFAERNDFYLLKVNAPEVANWVWYLFLGYGIFAFLSTMFREIVKDMEDVQGDAALDCHTLPVVWGFQVAKKVAMLFGGLLFLTTTYFTVWLFEMEKMLGLTFSVFGILLPTAIAIWQTLRATTQKEYHSLSQVTKFIMLSGLILLILIA